MQAIESIALNSDQHPGLVALALEMAALCTREGKTPEDLLLTISQYCDLVDRLYFTNVGGIFTQMGEEWKVSPPPGMPVIATPKTRSRWRQELGYDVLLHPKDMLPIRFRAGHLVFEGATALSEGGAKMSFRLPGGELLETSDFPEQWPGA